MPPTPQELFEGLTGLFEELDLNASGSVSMDELVSGLDRLGYDIRIDGGWAGGWAGKCALPALQASRCLLPVPASFLLSFPACFLASPACPAEMEKLMERVDVNGDGVIQLTEFVAGLVDWKALQNDSQWGYWVQMAFERLDKNGDGWLGLEEIMEQLPQEDGSTDAGGWAGHREGGRRILVHRCVKRRRSPGRSPVLTLVRGRMGEG